MRVFLLITLAVGLLLSLAGCGAAGGQGTLTTGTGGSRGIPSGPPAIQGTITSIDAGSIRVEEKPDVMDGSNKGVLRLTDETRILKPDGTAAGRSGLRAGQRVRAWVTGPVAESYPWQGEASVVVIDS